MQVEVEHEGRIAVVSVDEVGKGRWQWSYRIDGLGLRQGTDRPLPNQDIALSEGRDAALRALRAQRPQSSS